MRLVANIAMDVLYDANGGNNTLVIAAGAVEDDSIADLQIAEYRPTNVHLANCVSMWLLLYEIRRRFCSQDGVRQEARVIFGVDWRKERPRGNADIRKCKRWVFRVEGTCHASHINRLASMGARFPAVLSESEVLKDFHQSLLT